MDIITLDFSSVPQERGICAEPLALLSVAYPCWID